MDAHDTDKILCAKNARVLAYASVRDATIYLLVNELTGVEHILEIHDPELPGESNLLQLHFDTLTEAKEQFFQYLDKKTSTRSKER